MGSAPAAPWTLFVQAEVTEEEFKVSETFAASGKKSLHVKAKHAANTNNKSVEVRYNAPASRIPLKPGQVWTVRQILKIIAASSGGFQLTFAWYKEDNATLITTESAAAVFLGETGEKTLVATSKAAPAEAAFLGFSFTATSNVSGASYDFYLDCVISAEGTTVPTYFDGDSEFCEWEGTPGNSVSLAGAIRTQEIKKGAVTGSKIANETITDPQMAGESIKPRAIQGLAVTAAKIAGEAVETAKIKLGAITTALIANLAVTTEKLAQLSVTGEKIADKAVVAAKIAVNTIETGNIALEAITENRLSKAVQEKLNPSAWSALTLAAKVEEEAVDQVPGVRSEGGGTVARLRGVLHIKAAEKLAAGGLLFTAPAGFRPPKQIFFVIGWGVAKSTLVSMNTSGEAKVQNEISAGELLPLDGVTYNLT